MPYSQRSSCFEAASPASISRSLLVLLLLFIPPHIASPSPQNERQWSIQLHEPRFGLIALAGKPLVLRGTITAPSQTIATAGQLCLQIDASHHTGGTHVCYAATTTGSGDEIPFHLELEAVPPGTHEIRVQFRVGCDDDMSKEDDSNMDSEDNEAAAELVQIYSNRRAGEATGDTAEKRCREVEAMSLFDVLSQPAVLPLVATERGAGNGGAAE